MSPRSIVRRRRAGVAPVAVVALLVAGCTQTTIVPVTVGEIEVIPALLDAMVDDQSPLAIELRDLEGNLLPDRPVRWASLNPQVASVDDQGIVTAVGPGQALITATADGAVGTAQITVERRPEVRIQPPSVSFDAVAGRGGSVQENLAVDNGGGGTLGSLSASVAYGPEGDGWLSASLTDPSVPTELIVSARAANVGAGTYTAQVIVTDGQATTAVDVSMVVTEPPPEIDLNRSDLSFSATSGGPVPSAQSVQVTNGGGQSLTGLSTQIVYTGTGGWLSATISRGSAPATITVAPTTANLSAGSYQASVRVTSPVAETRTISVQYNVSDPNPPDAPSSLEVNPIGNARMDLDWEDESDNETRFEIERRRLGQTWTLVATVEANEEAYRDEGLQSSTWYQYRVRACNGGGCSGYSNWDSAWTSF